MGGQVRAAATAFRASVAARTSGLTRLPEKHQTASDNNDLEFCGASYYNSSSERPRNPKQDPLGIGKKRF